MEVESARAYLDQVKITRGLSRNEITMSRNKKKNDYVDFVDIRESEHARRVIKTTKNQLEKISIDISDFRQDITIKRAIFKSILNEIDSLLID